MKVFPDPNPYDDSLSAEYHQYLLVEVLYVLLTYNIPFATSNLETDTILPSFIQHIVSRGNVQVYEKGVTCLDERAILHAGWLVRLSMSLGLV